MRRHNLSSVSSVLMNRLKEVLMTTKLIGVAAAFALLGSATVFADPPRFGRDSVYVTPGSIIYSSKSSATAGTVRPGRSSVYASDAPPAPRAPSALAAVAVKPGRA